MVHCDAFLNSSHTGQPAMPSFLTSLLRPPVLKLISLFVSTKMPMSASPLGLLLRIRLRKDTVGCVFQIDVRRETLAGHGESASFDKVVSVVVVVGQCARVGFGGYQTFPTT